ncbi:MAG: hypothetical protein HY905_20805 [Deltaproteobacteria bacterium]|nr:hypothetical protein [Deltaproteobacteria bacterium]
MHKMLLLALFAVPLSCAEKVDCGKMKAKMDECGAAVVRKVAAGDDAAKLAAVPDSMIQSLMSTMLEPFNKQCADNGGKFADAKEINVCLAKATCDDFAACMAAHMK